LYVLTYLYVREMMYLDEIEQASAVLQPMRIRLLKLLAEPRTCTELGTSVGETPQKVYYHVKKLEAAGVVTRVDERRVRGIIEGIYQATAASYWLSPGLVGRNRPLRAMDRLSLGHLLTLAEDLQTDVAALAARPQDASDEEIPSVGVSAEVELAPDQRAPFLRDLQSALEDLLSRYGKSPTESSGTTFRIALACYPKGE
jgi:DNA-binding transcriptional ArsR family regulator